jgi:hypothetical protein
LKTLLKIFLVVLINFLVVPIIKNIYLYYTYHAPSILFKKGDYWEGVVDKAENMHYDFRITEKVKLLNDSMAIELRKIYYERINGNRSDHYGWGALLPYSNKYYEIKNDTIKLLKKYTPYMNVNWDKTLLYKISNDTMYISEFYPPEYWIKLNAKDDTTMRRNWDNNYFFKYLFNTKDDNYNYWGIEQSHENGIADFNNIFNLETIPREWVKLYKELFK